MAAVAVMARRKGPFGKGPLKIGGTCEVARTWQQVARDLLGRDLVGEVVTTGW
jgi:hypothetical protein